jgi:hypothetical protein
MWSTDTLYPEEPAGSPSRFNLTVKELLLSGGSGDLVGIPMSPGCLRSWMSGGTSHVYLAQPGTQRPKEDLGASQSQSVHPSPELTGAL